MQPFGVACNPAANQGTILVWVVLFHISLLHALPF